MLLTIIKEVVNVFQDTPEIQTIEMVVELNDAMNVQLTLSAQILICVSNSRAFQNVFPPVTVFAVVPLPCV